MTVKENMNEEREKLIKDIFYSCDIDSGTQRQALESIADYILEDRKRICAPLVKYCEVDCVKLKGFESLALEMNHVINETLKLAGLEDGK